jgi:hypothetical protein
MLDIVRYTKIDIDAVDPVNVYPAPEQMNPASNTGFLVKCAARIPTINFVDRTDGKIYACMETGKMSWVDPDIINRILKDENASAAFQAMIPRFSETLAEFRQQPAIPLSEEARLHTLGCLS